MEEKKTVKIETPVLVKFPNIHIGVVVIEGIDNSGDHQDIDKLLEGVENFIKMDFVPEKLAKHDLISPWRTAYSEFGSKPSRFHSSVEALTRRILKGENVPRVNKLVDMYNFVSLKHMVPIGGYDLEKIDGNIMLTFAGGSEKFVPLGTAKVENPDTMEVIYRDERKVLCRKWNYMDSESSKITEKTKDAVLIIDGLFPVRKDKVKEICEEIIELSAMFCRGKARYIILDKGNSETDI